MELYFIRHGQSQNNARWNDPNYIESPDPELTRTGVEQTEILAAHLEKSQLIREHEGWNPHNRHGFGLTHIYTSLMERAVHTAAPTAQRLQIPFMAWAEIHESGGIFGRDGAQKLRGLPGKSRSYFEEHFPQLALPTNLDGTGWWNERPFETEEQCHLRAEGVWAELLARHGDKTNRAEERVVFVSHGGFFVHLMCVILDLPWLHASQGFKSWFLLNNCSISRIDVRKTEITLCYLNRTDHLPDSLLTG